MTPTDPLRTVGATFEACLTDCFQYLALGHFVVGIITTTIILRLNYFERPQAIGQIALVWLVPILGALFILVFQSVVHKNMTTKSKPDSENHYRDEGLAVDLYHEVNTDD